MFAKILFHDLVFQDMHNRNEYDCQDLASQVLKSYDLVFQDMHNRNEHDCQDLASQVLKSYVFCNSMPPSHDNDCTIQDLAFQVLKLLG